MAATASAANKSTERRRELRGEEGAKPERTHGQTSAQHDHVVGLVHGAGCGATSPRPERSQDRDALPVTQPDPSAGNVSRHSDLSAGGNRPIHIASFAEDAKRREKRVW